MMRRSSLKQGKPLQRKTPLSRNGALARASFTLTKKADEEAKAPKVRKTLKSSRPKMTPIRRAARGQDCKIRLPGVCNYDPATTVLCHSNFLKDGKGMGLKAPDTAAAFGCSSCHDVLDGRRPRPEGMTEIDVENHFYVGMKRTHDTLRQMGLMQAEAA
jgi:hypothetical protein